MVNIPDDAQIITKEPPLRKGYIYVDGAKNNQRPFRHIKKWQILYDNHANLPLDAKIRFDEDNAAEAYEDMKVVSWSRNFREAYDEIAEGKRHGLVPLNYTLKQWVEIDLDSKVGYRLMTHMGRAYTAVIEAGSKGTTGIEAVRFKERPAGITTCLTKLHRNRVISRLNLKR